MIKLSDLLGGAFIALPEDQIPQDMDMPFERPPVVIEQPQALTGSVVAPWEQQRRDIEAEAAKPDVLPEKIEVPVVAPAAGLQMPWLKVAQQEALVEAASEPVPTAAAPAAVAQETQPELVQHTEPQNTTETSIEAAIANIGDGGTAEGWGPGVPSEEAATCQFRTETDAQDWVIAKGRSLSYSTIDRPDPFHVETMYGWVDESKHSHMLNRPITSFRMACRHAIASTVLFYEQDVNNHAALVAQRKADAATEQSEAAVTEAHQQWKALVEERKILLADLDRRVVEARDRWHALRK